MLNHRGAGTWFGIDVTTQFLDQNNLKLLIRSHELVEEGYQWLHNDRVLTVFSASNYCGKNMNKGAFVSFDRDLNAKVTSFLADETQFSTKALADETVKKLQRLIFEMRYPLAKRFTIYDKEETGKITRVLWAKGMTKVLQLQLPWLSLQPLLCKAESDGSINYIRFLERYRAKLGTDDTAWQEEMVAKISQRLFALSPTLKGAFKELDSDGNGKISYKEFVDALNNLSLGSYTPHLQGISKAGLYDLMRTVDEDSDNSISYEEFVARFQISFDHAKEKSEVDEAIYQKVKDIGAHIIKASS